MDDSYRNPTSFPLFKVLTCLMLSYFKLIFYSF